jgi:Zinc knuckle
LTGADKRRYGDLLEDLHNQYLGGKDNYPESLDSAMTLLTHYQDRKCGAGKPVSNNNNVVGTSFAQAQSMSKVRCYECNGYGHMRRNCPSLNTVNVQVDKPKDMKGEDRAEPRGRSDGWMS